jgi:hypothetical protein
MAPDTHNGYSRYNLQEEGASLNTKEGARRAKQRRVQDERDHETRHQGSVKAQINK